VLESFDYIDHVDERYNPLLLNLEAMDVMTRAMTSWRTVVPRGQLHRVLADETDADALKAIQKGMAAAWKAQSADDSAVNPLKEREELTQAIQKGMAAAREAQVGADATDTPEQRATLEKLCNTVAWRHIGELWDYAAPDTSEMRGAKV